MAEKCKFDEMKFYNFRLEEPLRLDPVKYWMKSGGGRVTFVRRHNADFNSNWEGLWLMK